MSGPAPSRVIVVGAAGSGVTRLVAALRAAVPAGEFDITEFDITEFHRRDGFPVVGSGGDGSGGEGSATVLLLIDPAAHADAEDVELMAAARAITPGIALVCTKTDAYWEWPRVLGAARELLDPVATLPVFAVSAAAADHGALDQSGLADLIDWLREENRAEPVVVDSHPSAGAAAIPPDPPDPPDPAALRRRIVADRERGRADRLSAARVEFGAVRSAAVAEVGARIAELGGAGDAARQGERRDGKPERGSPADRHRRLVTAACEVVDAVQTYVTDRLDEASTRVLLGTGAVASASSNPASTPMSGPAEIAAIVDRAWDRGGISATSRRRDAEDVLLAVIGLSSGIGVGRLIGAGLGELGARGSWAGSWMQWAAVPLGVLAGLAVAVWVIRSRRRTVTSTRIRTSTAEVLGEVRGLLERQVATRIGEVESEVAGLVNRHHDRQMRSAADQVAELDAERRQVNGRIGLR